MHVSLDAEITRINLPLQAATDDPTVTWEEWPCILPHQMVSGFQIATNVDLFYMIHMHSRRPGGRYLFKPGTCNDRCWVFPRAG